MIKLLGPAVDTEAQKDLLRIYWNGRSRLEVWRGEANGRRSEEQLRRSVEAVPGRQWWMETDKRDPNTAKQGAHSRQRDAPDIFVRRTILAVN